MIAMLERVCSGCGAGGMILWEALIVMVWVMLVSTFCRSARQRIRDFGGRLMIKVMKRLKRKGTEEGKMNVVLGRRSDSFAPLLGGSFPKCLVLQ
jgi:hypothetical protein